MGNCCAGKASDAEIAMGGIKGDNSIQHILDDREVAGLKGTDKIVLIVKLQALARGLITRRKV